MGSSTAQRIGRVRVGLISSLTFITTVLAIGTLSAYGDGVRASSSSSNPTTWGAAKAVPGIAALNVGYASVDSISCATAGNCAAGGSYATARDPLHSDELGFVVDESNGTWGKAQAISGLGSLTVFGASGGSWVGSVSCAAAGACAALGGYTDARGAPQGFVVDEVNGSWGTAQEIPGLGALNTGGNAVVRSLSCAAVGDCAAVGSYWSSTVPGSWQGFVVSESNGTWGTAKEIVGPGTAKSSEAFSVSCTGAGDCAAGGSFVDAQGARQGLVVEESSGTWGAAQPIPGLGALNAGGDATVAAISCAAPGDCAAGGAYVDAHGGDQGLVVDESGGKWLAAHEVSRLGGLNVGHFAAIQSISCAGVGACAAGGFYSIDALHHEQGFVVDESNGAWGAAQEVPGLGALNVGRFAAVQSISCGAAGSCAAGGYFNYKGGHGTPGFVVDESGGRWGRAEEVPGLSINNSVTGVKSVSCVPARHCAAVGDFLAGGGEMTEGYVISEPGSPPYCAPRLGLAAAVTGYEVKAGDVSYRVVLVNRGASVCELTGIPGALGYTTTGHVPVGPPAVRTQAVRRGGVIYLEPLGGTAETTFVIHSSAAAQYRTCRPRLIDRVIIRPMGVPQMVVSLDSPNAGERLVCRGLRNEAIYGFGPTGRPTN